ncbi:MAG: FliA/WhiG family RNA polymerase sigma factor [Dehalococcoidia bacterium]|nr:FliA/WhiG family RNA polymerase sigma factor [Dehalococcoidia bacterium]
MTRQAATALANEPSHIPADRDEAIQQYAPLVKYVVGRLAIGLPAILDYEDILSYGTIGLIEALDRYDGSKGVKFETYAISRIRGSIIDALRSLDRLPRSVRQKAKRLEQVTTELTRDLGRDPTEEEIANAMEMTLPQYNKTLVDSSWVTVSLDGLLERDDTGEGSSGHEMPADPDQEDFTERLEKRQTLEILTEAVKSLPEREWLIVSLYYKDEMTMKEIAQILEISESRVCQLHGRALGRLRTRISSQQAA